MIEHSIDEILELIWTLDECGDRRLESIYNGSEEDDTVSLISKMKEEKLVEEKGGDVNLTSKGADRARTLIRRHRLAECLLSQLFELENSHIEISACEFEHILSDQVTESVCTFLGHPPQCPHNKPIPRGECCKIFRKDVTPLVIRLSDGSLGEK